MTTERFAKEKLDLGRWAQDICDASAGCIQLTFEGHQVLFDTLIASKFTIERADIPLKEIAGIS